MITRNKLDKTFGPVGSLAGIFLFIAGLIIVLIGAFVGFTSTMTLVDFVKRNFKTKKRFEYLNYYAEFFVCCGGKNLF
jgi:hypothetical protein